ncbi:Vegetative incompatibility protein HET-E-1 [Fusarium equiseti]|uniref:Vegetative incompatibility protein HET-E-1 n=1 Tax=Fusarium equiseti TaxID=61235 RepID=A0ABQ8QWF1_FUSEQ|nr:Vegetative incompatibility protein HET-E-1 [Fusarium equiseti]
MRLLQYNDKGDIHLTEDYQDDDIPSYAILSHTWGADEVTFRDLTDGKGDKKEGYDKIRFCGIQALRDGLQYFWVDTCCIDKSSSTELQEALNCMYRWYMKADKCYVYLTDVSALNIDTDNDFSQWQWMPAFRNSRWFTRGWTLQELIAPVSVEFFSKEGTNLGNKKFLEGAICEVTGLPSRALRGSPMSSFSIPQRLSWIEKRNTKRAEDKAYSLFGIFDVRIPLMYGEGQKKAFERLQEEIDKGFKSGELGHYANEDHCSTCDGEYGHLADDLHCWRCGKFGHYADDPHCYRCKEYGHFKRDCKRW